MFAKGWLLSVALSCVAALGAAALAEPFEFVHEASRHNNLLPVWLEFQHREREYLANDEFKQKYVAARSWVNTYLGEYRAALGVGEPKQELSAGRCGGSDRGGGEGQEGRDDQ
jgi:hypothetical protein